MLTQLTERLHEYGMTRKHNSLSYIVAGIPHAELDEAITVTSRLENGPESGLCIFPECVK